MRSVWTNDGECLGDEWVDLGGLQKSSAEAILQIIYLDETIDTLIEEADSVEGILE